MTSISLNMSLLQREKKTVKLHSLSSIKINLDNHKTIPKNCFYGGFLHAIAKRCTSC